jgi:carbon storage regulator
MAEAAGFRRPPPARRSSMLVLTRKIDQGIVISGNIYVRVLGVERDRVKIGISAPTEISVLRQELLTRKEQAAAAKEREPNNGEAPSRVTTGEEES